jgi:2-methylcitrate dehydratase PrpD
MLMSSVSKIVPDVSRQLAKFTAEFEWNDVPEHVRHEAKRSLLNYFATALSACYDPTIEKALRVYGAFSNSQQATIIGRAARTDVLTAAAMNTMAANVFDFDDTHIPTIIHPTAPVASPVFAWAQARVVTGAEALLSFIVGAEVECRIGNGVSPGHYARGWHITSTCGVFGAACASARLLGLTEQQSLWALGSASVQAGGLVESLGTMAKSVSMGNAARNGMIAALLAQQNFDGPKAPIEGVRGFMPVTCDVPDFDTVVSDLGSRWELLQNTYKPYPCGVVLNPVIDACLDIASDAQFMQRAVQNISRIELVGRPLLKQRTDRPGIRTGRESQVSAQHAVPVSLVRGRAGLAEFSDEAVADPALQALGQKVCFIEDSAYGVEAATVRVHWADGFVLTRTVEVPQGSTGKPLTDAQIEEKLRTLCSYGKSGVQVEPLIDAVWSLDRARDAGALMTLVSGKA